MKRDTLAVIPSRYEPRRLAALVRTIVPEVDVLVLDNGHERLPWMRATALDLPGIGLYELWNRGVDWAREHGYRHVALLNDDIGIAPGVVTDLARMLDADESLGIAYPGTGARVCRDPAGPYEMTGFAFMFPTALPIRFDESWEWWYGDTAFERDVLRAGYGVARVPGEVRHQSDAERDDWARRPELREAAARDVARWAAMLEAEAVPA